ncbi:MAG: hypothetical protein ABIR56_01965, partial [Polaromonas sp.]
DLATKAELLMKTSTLAQNGISPEVVGLISRLVALIPWPSRRQAMGDVTVSILRGRARVAEETFGWGRSGVVLGLNERRSGIVCLNDLSSRRKPKVEDKAPLLLADIEAIMEPQSQAEPRLRTTLHYTHLTARSVRDALLAKGWAPESLPTVRTLSNVLNRQGYRLRTVAKTKVKKKPKNAMPSSPMFS